MTTMTKSRRWTGPAVFSYGFRPFFLGAAVWGGAMVALWAAWLSGWTRLPTALSPVSWHIHELLFGMVPAAIAGFLLTAIPNWTGRLPVVGLPLATLFTLWLTGRVAVATSAAVGLLPALVVSAALPAALVAVAAREVIASKNRRNVPVVAIIAVFASGEAVFAWEVLREGAPVYGHRIAIAAAVLLVTLIGGRITPSFTTNWLKRRGETRMPAPFAILDKAAVLVCLCALCLWAALPAVQGEWPGLVLIAAAFALVARQSRWRPLATWREPLLMALHVAYGFISVGLALSGAGTLMGWPVVGSSAVHAFTMGALALMILAVMTRATRGHTGRSLEAPISTTVLYAALIAATLTRILATLAPSYRELLVVSAAGWIVAFLGFAALYGPMLLTHRSKTA